MIATAIEGSPELTQGYAWLARREPIRAFREKACASRVLKTPSLNLAAHKLMIATAIEGSPELTQGYAWLVLKARTKMKLGMPPAVIVCQGGTHKVVVAVSALAVRCLHTLILGV